MMTAMSDAGWWILYSILLAIRTANSWQSEFDNSLAPMLSDREHIQQ